jgi:hypothetical protein
MPIELQIALLGIVVAVVIGAWQILLARKQVQAAQSGSARTESTRETSGEPPPNADNLLHRLWSRFDAQLQDALSLAYNQARREGKTRISTRTFFAAVARLRPGLLPQLLDRLPHDALPEPVGEDLPHDKRLLHEEPLLSSCVENAVVRLGQKADPQHPLSVAEVFVDVAKHGTGASVVQLREHGITPDRIDQLVEELGWHVRER